MVSRFRNFPPIPVHSASSTSSFFGNKSSTFGWGRMSEPAWRVGRGDTTCAWRAGPVSLSGNFALRFSALSFLRACRDGLRRSRRRAIACKWRLETIIRIDLGRPAGCGLEIDHPAVHVDQIDPSLHWTRPISPLTRISTAAGSMSGRPRSCTSRPKLLRRRQSRRGFHHRETRSVSIRGPGLLKQRQYSADREVFPGFDLLTKVLGEACVHGPA